MVTCFNCNIGIYEFDKVMERLAMLVKPEGVVRIYFSESYYDPREKGPYSMFFKIYYLMNCSFGRVGVPTIRDDIGVNRFVYECKEPRKWLIAMEQERRKK